MAVALAFMLVALAAESSLREISPPLPGLAEKDLRDMFNEIHNGHAHEAIDIAAPRGTPIHAVIPGTIRRLFLSKPGGNTIYEFDNAGSFCYYYAHLDSYAPGLTEGAHVERGEVIGFVGSTGNARPEAPHLHFAVFELGTGKEWWKGKAINPYQALVEAVKRTKPTGGSNGQAKNR